MKDELTRIQALEGDERAAAIAQMAAEATPEVIADLFAQANGSDDLSTLAKEVLAKIPEETRYDAIDAIADDDARDTAEKIEMELELQVVADIEDETARNQAIAAEAAIYAENADADLRYLYDAAANLNDDLNAIAKAILKAIPLEQRITAISEMDEDSGFRAAALTFEQKTLNEVGEDGLKPFIVIIGATPSVSTAQAVKDVLITDDPISGYFHFTKTVEGGVNSDLSIAYAAALLVADQDVATVIASSLQDFANAHYIGTAAIDQVYRAVKETLKRDDLVSECTDSLTDLAETLQSDYSEETSAINEELAAEAEPEAVEEAEEAAEEPAAEVEAEAGASADEAKSEE